MPEHNSRMNYIHITCMYIAWVFVIIWYHIIKFSIFQTESFIVCVLLLQWTCNRMYIENCVLILAERKKVVRNIVKKLTNPVEKFFYFSCLFESSILKVVSSLFLIEASTIDFLLTVDDLYNVYLYIGKVYNMRYWHDQMNALKSLAQSNKL